MVPRGPLCTQDIFTSLLRRALCFFCSSSRWPQAMISCHLSGVLMHPPSPAEHSLHPQVEEGTQDRPELAWLSPKSTFYKPALSLGFSSPSRRTRSWTQGGHHPPALPAESEQGPSPRSSKVGGRQCSDSKGPTAQQPCNNRFCSKFLPWPGQVAYLWLHWRYKISQGKSQVPDHRNWQVN